jgi:hypothetical protein
LPKFAFEYYYQNFLPLYFSYLELLVRSMLLSKSEGSIGEIMTILTRAASEAIVSGKEFIDLEILEKTKYNSPSERRRLYESVLI